MMVTIMMKRNNIMILIILMIMMIIMMMMMVVMMMMMIMMVMINCRISISNFSHLCIHAEQYKGPFSEQVASQKQSNQN